MVDRLKQLSDAGVSIWLDDLSRERLASGSLVELIDKRHVVGVTTNPTIFASALSNGEQVKLSGFGNFDLRDKNQRPGRNPKTGEEIPISARRVVTFRPGQKLKARVEAYVGAKE